LITIFTSLAGVGEAVEQAAHAIKPPAPSLIDLGGSWHPAMDASTASPDGVRCMVPR